VNARKLRRVVQGLRRALQRVAAAPHSLYTWMYIRLSLNRAYHRLGLSGRMQVRLIPRRLPVTRRLMRQPYWVPVRSIRWGGRPRGGEARLGGGCGCGLVFKGNWDTEDKHDIDDYLSRYIYSKTVFQLFRDALPYQQTAQFREISSFVRRGLVHEWQARGCRTEADIERYFIGLRHTFEAIRLSGYKTQEQLGKSRWFDEIKVFVDRYGELHKQQGAGHHRLAMARILELDAIPVLVVGVHRDWALRVQSEIGEDVLTSIDRKLRQLSKESLDYAPRLGPPVEEPMQSEG
jgi:hypothetical protein